MTGGFLPHDLIEYLGISWKALVQAATGSKHTHQCASLSVISISPSFQMFYLRCKG